jgi:hypothetical protein
MDCPFFKGIFSDICLLISVPNFPVMIDPALSPIAFQARSPVYALKRAHMRAISMPYSFDSSELKQTLLLSTLWKR